MMIGWMIVYLILFAMVIGFYQFGKHTGKAEGYAQAVDDNDDTQEYWRGYDAGFIDGQTVSRGHGN